MAKIPVSQLREGDNIEDVFLLREYRLSTTKNGRPFARVRLGDASGTVAGIYWDIPQQAVDVLRKAKHVLVKGTVRTYQDALQLNVDSLEEKLLSKEEASAFLPHTDKDIDAYMARLRKIMDKVRHPHLAALVEAIFADEDLCSKFKRAPAASQMHHAYIGGLLEHTTSMAEAALKLCEHYEQLDRDLLLVGVLIHDIGKVDEFRYQTEIDYSDTGRLVGHIAIGVSILEEKVADVEGFPKALLDVLKHYVLSHHGVPEFGAVRRPMTAEAVVLHYLDNIDAKLEAFFRAVSEEPGANDSWTPYQKMFEGYLYKGDAFAGGPAEEGDGKNEAAIGGPAGTSLF